ncbi:DNA-3-methyladenine glycosylase family protein [Cohnella sp. GCM10027633]|uniref:DNA-3-methyladenine glycosylase family protein n=1 Tax=unclassified Cohnella TaxID=2636738 RepID=UPI0036400637
MTSNEFTIEVPGSFDYDANVAYLSRSPNECLHAVVDGAIWKRIPTGLSDPLVRISGSGNAPLHVRMIEAKDAPPSQEEVQAIARYVREWFDLDSDLEPFYAMARQDAILGDVAERFRGLRIVGIPDLFEAICWGILGQQINLAFAYALKRRIVETFGKATEHEGRRYWTFPEPAAIAALSPDALTPLQITGRKSEYLIGVARLVADGALGKRMLLDAGDAKTAERMLVGIRGIGPWTANYVLMRCLRYPSAFPIDDVGLHNALKAVLDLPDKPSVARIRELAAGWAGWEAYATFYLWRVLY